MTAYAWVFLGGGLGSICRFGIAHLMKQYDLIFPWATFAANALSCIMLGALIGISLRSGMSSEYKWLLMTGFCGGFSTFSTFANESFVLFESGMPAYAMLNILLSLVVCFFCIYLGIRVFY